MKRLMCMLLALVMVLSMIPVAAMQTHATVIETPIGPESGTCGENATWVLEDGVLTIAGTGAMNNYSAVADIPWYEYRDTITALVVADGITHIGDMAFESLRKVLSADLPDSVVSIGKYAFEDCNALVSLDLGAGVRLIDQRAFQMCYSMTQITLPDTLISIGDLAFSYCSSLQFVDIPSGVTTVGACAFRYCSGLEEVYFTGNAPTIGDNAFQSVKATVCYPAAKNNWENVVGNHYGGTLTWEAIGGTNPEEEGFAGTCGDNLTWVLEEGVLTISGEGAMYDYNGDNCAPWAANRNEITKVLIEEGVTGIGTCAFMGCALEEAVFSASVELFSDSAFDGCVLKKMVFLGDIPATGSDVFMAAEIITICYPANNADWEAERLSHPGSIVSWGPMDAATGEVLYYTGNCGENITWLLKDGKLTVSGTGRMSPFNVEDILVRGYWAPFRHQITSVVLEEGVANVGGSAFYNCPGVTQIILPESNEHIGRDAFLNSGLTEIHFQGNAPEINFMAFNQVTATAYYPANNETWTEDVRQDYGGNITWVAVGGEEVTNVTVADVKNGTNGECYQVEGIVTFIDGRNMYIQDETGGIGVYLNSAAVNTAVGDKIRVLGTRGIHNHVIELADVDESDSHSYQILSSGNHVEPLEISLFGIFNDMHGEYGAMLVTVTDTLRIESVSEYSATYQNVTYEASEGRNPSTITLYRVHTPAEEDILEVGTLVKITGVVSGTDEMNQMRVTEMTPVVTSGTCGDNLTWNLDNGVLTISGTGPMDDYMGGEDPWAYVQNFITHINIQEGVTHIGNYAFHFTDNLQTVSLPSTLVSIGECAFGMNRILTQIKLPDGLQTIGAGAFEECGEMTSITIPGSVTSIGDMAFNFCSGLTEVQFMGDMPDFGQLIFQEVTATAYYPSDRLWIAEEMRQVGGNITWVAVDSTLASGTCGKNVNWSLNRSGTLTISGTGAMDNFGLWQQPWAAYAEEIYSVNILEGITNVGNYAFHGCSVTYASLPESLTTIGSNAFYGCGLKEIQIPYGVTSIGSGAFYGNRLTAVYIPSTVKTLDTYAFGCCADLTDVTLEQGLETIGKYAFEACEKLTWIQIPNTVTRILDGAFGYCSSLEEINIGGNAPAMADNVFEGVTATVYYPPDYPALEALIGKNFGGQLTWSCLGMPAPKSGQCGDNVYWTLDVHTGTLTITGTGAMWDNEDGDPWWLTNPRLVTSVVINEGVTSVGRMAFMDYGNITSVKFPSTLTTIGGGAFNGCAIENVTIPAGVTEIGDYAFWCVPSSRLKNVTVHGNPTIGANAFGGAEMDRITFTGDAPVFDEHAFYGTTTYIAYPADNATWYDLVGQHFGGTLIWCPDGESYIRPQPDEIEEIASGTFDDHCTWTLYNDGLLHISSAGDLPAYMFFDGAPWYEYRTQIWEVSIGGTITGIDNGHLFRLPLVEKITIGPCVSNISSDAFSGATRNLHTVIFEGDAPDISADAFTGVTADVYYDNAKLFWEDVAGKNYGGDLTWRQPCPHEDTRVVGKTKPTCTETGYTGNTVCTDCGATVIRGEEIPANGHTFGAWYVEVPNGYMANGEEHRDCKNCNHYESRVLEFVFTLDQVQNVRATSKKTSVKLSYDKVAGADRYEIYVDGEYIGSTSSTSYTVEKLTCGVSYEFMVVARDKNGDNYRYGPGSEPVVARPYVDLDNGYKASLSETEAIYDGEAQLPAVTVKKSSSGNHDVTEGVDYIVSYENNIDIGTATVTITGINRCGGTITKTFDILPGQVENVNVEVVSEDTLRLTFDSVLGADAYWIYQDGKRIAETEETSYTVTGLKAGKNYKFSVKANAVVYGENYTGEASESDSGKPVYRLENCTVAVKYAERAYTGKARTNTFTVKTPEGKTLKEDTDYTVSYENNKDIGTATATINGKGKYEGILTASFDVVPPQMGDPKVKAEQLEHGTALNISFKGVSQAEWFAIYLNGELYTKTEEFGHFTQYLEPGAYSVTVCAGVTIDGKEYIGAMSDAVKVTVRKSAAYCTAVLSEYEFVYTGKTHKPTVTVYGYDGEVLTEGMDYTVSYKNNKSTGKGYVEISGKGNYNGTLKEYFTIHPAQVTGLKVSSTTQTSVKISFNKDSSNSTKYYNVYVDGQCVGRTTGNSYTIKNLEMGKTYRIHVVGEKTVSGVTYQGYESDPITVWPGTSIGGYKVILDYTKATFTGEALRPGVVVKTSSKSSAKTLVEDVDYIVSYENNVDPGKAKVIIQAEPGSDYTGTITKTFTINPPKVENVTATAVSNTSIEVSFDAAPGATGYWIYVNGDRKAKVTDPCCVITGLKKNKTYKITVKSVTNVDGTNYTSDYTDAVSCKTVFIPAE